MNADLTFNSIVFKKSFDENGGSERRSTARGINLPDVLSIRSQSYVDSSTKVPGTRYTARVDLTALGIDGIAPTTVSAYFVIAVPSTTVSSDVTTVVTTFKAIVADSGFITAVLNSEK